MKTFRYLIVAVLFLLVAGTSGAQTREENLSSTYKCNFLGADNKQ